VAPGPVWKGAENLAPTGIRSPDRLKINNKLCIVSTLNSPPSVRNSGYSPAGTVCIEVLSYEGVMEIRLRERGTRESETKARTGGRYVTLRHTHGVSFQCHAMTTLCGVWEDSGRERATHFGPTSVYVYFSYNDHRSSGYVLPFH
jgi:hypothetical protein